MSHNRLFLPLIKWTALLLGASAFSLGGCQTNDTGTAQAALTAVQGSVATCEALGAAVQQCLSARGTCLEAAAADAAGQEACKATFASCLPVDATNHGGPDGHHGPGKGHHGPGGEHKGAPAGGDHDGGKVGGDMANGCGGGEEEAEDACNPGSPIVLACKADLETCLAGAGADTAGCIETAKGCVATAIDERFHSVCEAQAGSCAESDADPIICEQISTACKDGLALAGGTAVAKE